MPVTANTPMTQRQKDVLSFVREFIAMNSFPPTIRDIGEVFDLTVNGVVNHLKTLKKRGLLDWTPHKSRSLRLTEKKQCPHCGKEI